MSAPQKNLDRENRSLIGRLLLLVVAMFGFGFLLVPLYDVFCEITGFGGRTNTAAVAVEEAPDLSREIRVEFVTTVNSYAPFEFSADVDSMTVNPGQHVLRDIHGEKSQRSRQSRAGCTQRRARFGGGAFHEDRVFLFYEPGVSRR